MHRGIDDSNMIIICNKNDNKNNNEKFITLPYFIAWSLTNTLQSRAYTYTIMTEGDYAGSHMDIVGLFFVLLSEVLCSVMSVYILIAEISRDLNDNNNYSRK